MTNGEILFLVDMLLIVILMVATLVFITREAILCTRRSKNTNTSDVPIRTRRIKRQTERLKQQHEIPINGEDELFPEHCLCTTDCMDDWNCPKCLAFDALIVSALNDELLALPVLTDEEQKIFDEMDDNFIEDLFLDDNEPEDI